MVGELTAYASRELFDADNFADRAAGALEDDEVRGLIGAGVADGIIKSDPDLIGGRPLIEGAAEGIVGSAPFEQLFRGAVADLHRTVFASDKDTIALKVADAGVLVIEALRQVAPRVARAIPDDVEPRLVALTSGDGERVLAEAARFAEGVGWTAVVALVLAAILFAASIWIARDRRRAVRRVGISVAVVGVVGVVGLEIGRAVLAGRFEDSTDADAARALWDAFLGDLQVWSFVLALCGTVVAAAAASLIRPVDIAPALNRAWAAVAATPQTPRLRVVRAIALVVVGVVVIAARDTVIRLAVVLIGVAVIYLGVTELLRMALPPEAEEERAPRRRPIRQRRPAIVALVAAAAVAMVVAVAAVAGGSGQGPLDIRECNGDASLCDRTIAEVSFPSTHNSMSAADQEGWLFAQQERGIPSQLQAGIRGLLIDTHYGVDTKEGVYTVLQKGSKSREKLAGALGERFVRTAEQLRERLGYTGGGERQVYLCHAYCEVGATPAVDALESIRDYLVENPYEVLLISVEDDTAPEDTAGIFEDSGLLDMVWRRELDPERLPTLRRMILTDRRVVVMVEEETGDIPWLNQQFDLVQETPFSFDAPSRLASKRSCDLNRGESENPLFLLNNWVETTPAPLPSKAGKVNAYRTLLKRARVCGRLRDRLPNLVAVDFYEEGDVTRVTQTLNEED